MATSSVKRRDYIAVRASPDFIEQFEAFCEANDLTKSLLVREALKAVMRGDVKITLDLRSPGETKRQRRPRKAHVSN